MEQSACDPFHPGATHDDDNMTTLTQFDDVRPVLFNSSVQNSAGIQSSEPAKLNELARRGQDAGRLIHMSSLGMRRDPSDRKAFAPSLLHPLVQAGSYQDTRRRELDVHPLRRRLTVERDASSEVFRREPGVLNGIGAIRHALFRTQRVFEPPMPAFNPESQGRIGRANGASTEMPKGTSLRASAPPKTVEPRPVFAHALDAGASTAGASTVEYRTLE